MSFIIQILTSDFILMLSQDLNPKNGQNYTFFNRALLKLKNYCQIIKEKIENFIALSFTIFLFFPIWIFKIIFKVIDLIEFIVKLVLKICVRVIAGIIHIYMAIFKLLGFVKLANFIQKKFKFILINKKKSKSQSSQASSQTQSYSQNSQLQQRQKNEEQYKINPPDIFSKKPLKAYNASTDEVQDSQEFKNNFFENKNIIPERETMVNIVSHPNEIKTPKLFTDSKVHSFGMKRHPSNPNIYSAFQVQELEKIKNIVPDRDQSSKFQKEISFKKNLIKSAEHEILLSNTHKVQAKKQQKQELQRQIERLRKNMNEVVLKNENQIAELQEWLTQKNLTLNICKKEKIQIIQQMERLQKENSQKTLKYKQLEVKIKQIQEELKNQRFQKSELLIRIDELQEQIKQKTIEIMSLRQKIQRNYEHIEQMSNLLDERIQEDSQGESIKMNEYSDYKDDTQSIEKYEQKQEKDVTIQKQNSSTKLSDQYEEKEVLQQLKAQEIQEKIMKNVFVYQSNEKIHKKNKKKNKKKHQRQQQNTNTLPPNLLEQAQQYSQDKANQAQYKIEKTLNQTNDDSNLFI